MNGTEGAGRAAGSSRKTWLTIALASAAAVACGVAVALLLRPSSPDPAGSAQTADPVSGLATSGPPATTEPAPAPTSLATPPAPSVAATAPVAQGGWQATSPTRGQEGVESAAISLARTYELLPIAADGTGQCEAGDIVVSYVEPDFDFVAGAYAPPLGPEPDDSTLSVNGVVVCRTSQYAVMGFEATWAETNATWIVIPVPAVD